MTGVVIVVWVLVAGCGPGERPASLRRRGSNDLARCCVASYLAMWTLRSPPAKHGISDVAMTHALYNAIRYHDLGDGLVMAIGAAPDGLLLPRCRRWQNDHPRHARPLEIPLR